MIWRETPADRERERRVLDRLERHFGCRIIQTGPGVPYDGYRPNGDLFIVDVKTASYDLERYPHFLLDAIKVVELTNLGCRRRVPAWVAVEYGAETGGPLLLWEVTRTGWHWSGFCGDRKDHRDPLDHCAKATLPRRCAEVVAP